MAPGPHEVAFGQGHLIISHQSFCDQFVNSYSLSVPCELVTVSIRHSNFLGCSFRRRTYTKSHTDTGKDIWYPILCNVFRVSGHARLGFTMNPSNQELPLTRTHHVDGAQVDFPPVHPPCIHNTVERHVPTHPRECLRNDPNPTRLGRASTCCRFVVERPLDDRTLSLLQTGCPSSNLELEVLLQAVAIYRVSYHLW